LQLAALDSIHVIENMEIAGFPLLDREDYH